MPFRPGGLGHSIKACMRFRWFSERTGAATRLWRWAIRRVAVMVVGGLALVAGCSDQGPAAGCAPGAPKLATVADSSVRWTLVGSPTTRRLSAVRMVDPTTGFAVGDSGTVLLYGGGTVWAVTHVGPPSLLTNFYGVEANASGSWWVAGDSGTVIYAPTRTGGFAHQSTNALVTLYSIKAVGATSELFAVGEGGVILHVGSGASYFTTWTAQVSPTANALYFTGGPASTNFFAAGQAGVAAHFDGVSWSSDAVGTSVPLRSGAHAGNQTTPVTDVWLVGDGGTIVHSTTGASGTWSPQPSGTTENLFGITADSSARAFAVGSKGTILHWDGTRWNAMATPTTATLRAISRGFSAAVDYWVVGDCGTLLHGTP